MACGRFCWRLDVSFECVQVCCVYTGMTFEVKIEADSNDSNDITEHPHDDKSRPYSCTVCDKRSTRKGNLNQHKQIHTGGTLYSCTECKKRFTNQDSLRKHMNVHSSKYICTECGKCFSSNLDLTVHKRSHSGEKPFECTVCSRRFTHSGHLARHSRIHSGEKPFKCPECDKAFNESVKLTIHIHIPVYSHSHESPHRRQTIQVFTVWQKF